ncbi:MAG: (d)CMP kinase [Anaerolineales bacterium]|nr:MAG: (d)CMP kinase [Anaerolineales bacterium]
MIAIDGPAASGKSTLAQNLASALDYLYFDTGVMYRAVTLATLKSDTLVKDEVAVTAIANELDLDVQPPSNDDGRQCDVLMNGKDVTWEIRSPAVDENVSQVSMYPGVRQAMTVRQREIGLRGAVVMVGRDIGTVVLPEAELKIYLDASVEARANRRYEESLQRGNPVEYDVILKRMRERDRLDSTRTLAPLRPADDAVILDSTKLSIHDVFEKALALVEDVTQQGEA